jgi:hypothetical protein
LRRPNTNCYECKKGIYVRPAQQIWINRCKECRNKISEEKYIKDNCKNCKAEIKYLLSDNHNKPRNYCSISCSNKARTGIQYDKSRKYDKCYVRKLRLECLKRVFGINHCMIEGCNYNKTYDVHRLIPGKQGGEYKLGNMFAICPNHHAEIHRKICRVEKINDSKLRAVYD